VILNVAAWLRNGLWDGLPAIEPLALLYFPPHTWWADDQMRRTHAAGR